MRSPTFAVLGVYQVTNDSGHVAQEESRKEELQLLAGQVLSGFDITQPGPYSLLSKIVALCRQVHFRLYAIAF